MKSFSKFQYENRQLDEFVGRQVGQLARGAVNRTMGAAQNIGKKTKQTLINKSQQFRQGQTAGVGTPNATKYQKGGALVSKRQDQNPLRPIQLQQKALPPARAQNNPKVVSTGIKSVMNRNKLKAQKALASKRGQDVTRAAVGAIKGATSFQQDKERVDTGAGGMGTAMRQMSNVGKAAIQGALGSGKGQKLFGKDKKGDIKNTLADRLVGKIKRKAQKSVGLTPSTPKAAARTRGGRDITTGAGDQAISDRQAREKRDRITSSAARSAPRSAVDPKPRKQTSNVTGKSPTASVDASAVRKQSKEEGQKKVDKETTKYEKDQAKKNPNFRPAGPGSGMEGAPRDIMKDIEDDDKERKNKKDTETRQQKFDRYMNVARKAAGKDRDEQKKMENIGKGTDITPSNKSTSNKKSLTGDSVSTYKGGNGGETIEMEKDASGVFQARTANKNKKNSSGAIVKAANPKNKNKTSQPALPPAGVDRSTTDKTKTVKAKRRSVANPKYYDTDESGKKVFNQKRYDDDKGAVPTKKGGGRPKKPTNEEVELSEINRIAIAKRLANAGVQTKARSFAQMQKDKARQEAIKKITNESISNWREEFIWETDKKSPDKVKEIKPMSGKNTITINPEDETSKYKRGY